jgi:hypothetical protein
MKRFELILAVAATMAAIMAFSAAPAMAAPEGRFFDDGFFILRLRRLRLRRCRLRHRR